MTLAAIRAVVVCGTVLASSAAAAGTLENLERERSILIETLLSAELTPAERAARIAGARPRLIDLERMVLRDDKLVGRNTPTVRRAFESYDLTFLAHAAIERGASVAEVWLDQVGVSTQALMAARQGRR